MVKKLADFLMSKLGRVVFLVASLIIFFSSIFLLEYFADSRDIWTFDCHSDMYEFSTEQDTVVEHEQGLLYLSLSMNKKQISLDYYNSKGSKDHEYASFEGELTELEVGDVIYELALELKDFQFQEHNPFLHDYLLRELHISDEQLALHNKITVAVQVIEMDIKKKYILIKFKPYNMLWACLLHE
ncbi:hypothetical protein [Shewanella donghaensis]|uniref:hypothetical protein n=1 Tax=Shewanella donghaensis TaxID=238836 RepID=UPI0011845193|nr:hypothetical protein [Shewanella donghaensis]